jgi:DNA-binding GntR family transcriptional regulator
VAGSGAVRADVEPDEPGGLVRPTSAQQVAGHIRAMIFDQRLKAGERVPQDDIAADLRVSRVPVREAVIALDREGWVTNEPHRGAFVNGLDENSVRDHYELLGMLYGLAARRVAERGGPAQVAVLAELHKAVQAAKEPAEFIDRNAALLRRMVSMARSRRIKAMLRVMATNLVPGNFFAEVPSAMRLQKRGLRAVLKALRAGDGAAAEGEFVTMLRQEADEVVTLMAERGLLADADA